MVIWSSLYKQSAELLPAPSCKQNPGVRVDLEFISWHSVPSYHSVSLTTISTDLNPNMNFSFRLSHWLGVQLSLVLGLEINTLSEISIEDWEAVCDDWEECRDEADRLIGFLEVFVPLLQADSCQSFVFTEIDRTFCPSREESLNSVCSLYECQLIGKYSSLFKKKVLGTITRRMRVDQAKNPKNNYQVWNVFCGWSVLIHRIFCQANHWTALLLYAIRTIIK